jgi:hypothetical protein
MFTWRLSALTRLRRPKSVPGIHAGGSERIARRAIFHTPLEDMRTPRSFLSYAAQAAASFILELPFRISQSGAVIEAVANP